MVELIIDTILQLHVKARTVTHPGPSRPIVVVLSQ